MKKISLKKLILIILLTFQGYFLIAQDTVTIDFNDKYKFPFSLGVGYSTYFFIGREQSGNNFTFNDISLTGRIPIQPLPVLQPMFQIGTILVEAQDLENEVFNNTQIYANLGAVYSHKISKQFEVGADLGAGVGMAMFPDFSDIETPIEWMFNAQVGASLGLNLSYNFAIEANPRLKFTQTFTDYAGFPQINNMINGFSFTLGLTASYRIGEDPDSPKAKIRGIDFSDVKVDSLFGSMQSYYVNEPIGSVTLTNIEKYTLNDLEVSFFQSGYMDDATIVGEITSLDPGESETVDLFATFNDQVFQTEGVIPLTGKVSVSYDARGREVIQDVTTQYDLHDKESMVWDDSKKVGAFITPKDTALRNYSSYLRQINRDFVNDGLSETLQIAMQIYYGLEELGIIYQRDPTSPFDAAQEDAQIVDAVSLPRNTLKRATGDCDDLTVLFNSLLETVGVETAFITTPGHIYSAFNTKIDARDYKEINPSKTMSLNINGQLWVPVEITMIGQEGQDFLKAWRLGIEQFAMYDDDISKREFIHTRDAQNVYRPVGLQEADLGLQYGDETNVARDFYESVENLTDLIINDYSAAASNQGDKASYNKLGMICATLGALDRAESAFNTALSLNRSYLPAKINLGNVFFMKEEYHNALKILHSAEEDYEKKGRTSSSSYLAVLLNISKSYYELENYDKAAQYTEKIKAIDPELGARYSYLSDVEGTRAADVGASLDIVFVEEE